MSKLHFNRSKLTYLSTRIYIILYNYYSTSITIPQINIGLQKVERMAGNRNAVGNKWKKLFFSMETTCY